MNKEKSVNARNFTSTKLIIYAAISELNLQWKLRRPRHNTLLTYQNTFIFSKIHSEKITLRGQAILQNLQ